MTKIVVLADRGLLRVTGPDAADFLQNLITNDLEKTTKNGSVFAALLTPQGKISYEFFIVAIESGYLLDTPMGGVSELLRRLMLYKMRADVVIENVSADHKLYWLREMPGDVGTLKTLVSFKDPRHDEMGCRVIVETENCAGFDLCEEDLYLRRRIELGVPDGGVDYVIGDTFPHEAGYDLLDGVDFKKGCYVGQEVVSRMEHRSTARKRIVCVTGVGDLSEAGGEIKTESSMIGVLGSCVGKKGLALVRLDRAASAMATGHEMMTDGVEVKLSIPSYATYDFPVKEE